MVRLIFGCGYLGHRVARRWLAAGEPVFAVTRSAQRAAEFRREGLEVILADVTQPATLGSLPVADTVLYAIGYDRRSSTSREEVCVDGLRHVLAALSPETGRFLYISSTGVYGSSAGEWIDEDTPCRPTREAGRAMLAAEQVLHEDRLAARTIILRMAGLYGPGRLPRMADLAAGHPIAVAEEGYLNLIHVDDAASVVAAAETRPQPPRTYVVSDGHPCRRRDFYRHLATLLAQSEPEFVEPAPDTSKSDRARENKRIRNTRMLRELDLQLQYPSYQEGLATIANRQTGP